MTNHNGACSVQCPVREIVTTATCRCVQLTKLLLICNSTVIMVPTSAVGLEKVWEVPEYHRSKVTAYIFYPEKPFTFTLIKTLFISYWSVLQCWNFAVMRKNDCSRLQAGNQSYMFHAVLWLLECLEYWYFRRARRLSAPDFHSFEENRLKVISVLSRFFFLQNEPLISRLLLNTPTPISDDTVRVVTNWRVRGIKPPVQLILPDKWGTNNIRSPTLVEARHSIVSQNTLGRTGMRDMIHNYTDSSRHGYAVEPGVDKRKRSCIEKRHCTLPLIRHKGPERDAWHFIEFAFYVIPATRINMWDQWSQRTVLVDATALVLLLPWVPEGDPTYTRAATTQQRQGIADDSADCRSKRYTAIKWTKYFVTRLF